MPAIIVIGQENRTNASTCLMVKESAPKVCNIRLFGVIGVYSKWNEVLTISGLMIRHSVSSPVITRTQSESMMNQRLGAQSALFYM